MIPVGRLVVDGQAAGLVEPPVAPQSVVVHREQPRPVPANFRGSASFAPDDQFRQLPVERLVRLESAANRVLVLAEYQPLDGQRAACNGRISRLRPQGQTVEVQRDCPLVGVAHDGEVVPLAVGHWDLEVPADPRALGIDMKNRGGVVGPEVKQKLVTLTAMLATDEGFAAPVGRVKPEFHGQAGLSVEHRRRQEDDVVGAVERQRGCRPGACQHVHLDLLTVQLRLRTELRQDRRIVWIEGDRLARVQQQRQVKFVGPVVERVGLQRNLLQSCGRSVSRTADNTQIDRPQHHRIGGDQSVYRSRQSDGEGS